MTRTLSILAIACILVAFALLSVIAPGADADFQIEIMGYAVVLVAIGGALILTSVFMEARK